MGHYECKACHAYYDSCTCPTPRDRANTPAEKRAKPNDLAMNVLVIEERALDAALKAFNEYGKDEMHRACMKEQAKFERKRIRHAIQAWLEIQEGDHGEESK